MSVSIYGSGQTVLQVVSATNGTFTSTTSSTYSDTGLTATITPQSTTSKILVIVDISGTYATGAGNAILGLQLVRNGSSILQIEGSAGYSAIGTAERDFGNSGCCNYLDSPLTTSPTTYKVQFKNVNAAGTAGLNNYNQAATTSSSTITLLEISGS